MTQEQAQKVLDELQGVRTEMLNGEAKRLFEAIIKIADERDELKTKFKELESDNYELNNIINDLLDCIPAQKIKDRIEELNKTEQKLQNNISDEEREEYSDANISFDLMDINIRREELQGLLESE